MIFINVKYQVKPSEVDTFLEKVQPYTDACRAEEGCLFFEWYRSAERENEFLLVEIYKDAAAGKAHVNSDHFKPGLELMRPLITETPEIVSKEVDGDGWGEMGELQI